jgi:hypothetical protein
VSTEKPKAEIPMFHRVTVRYMMHCYYPTLSLNFSVVHLQHGDPQSAGRWGSAIFLVGRLRCVRRHAPGIRCYWPVPWIHRKVQAW